jgi:hypothetical protein
MWHYSNPNNFKHNLTAQILCTMNQLGISFKYDHFQNPPSDSHILYLTFLKRITEKLKIYLKNEMW